MKLTKKILSLVLAAALVLGSIAVAANAADYDGLTYEGSELAYKIEADKTEVKPGETVTFSVYMKNNYYIGASGGEFFLWTKGAFNAVAEENVVFDGIVAKTYNVTPSYEPASGMYPSTHAYDSWDGYLASRNANAGTVPEIISDFALIYKISLTVKEDVEPGTTITFEMPEGSLKSAAQTGRKGTIYQAMAKAVDNAATSIAYSESVDLSAASVTIKVASAAVLGEITDVQGSETYVNDTAVVTVNVTGAPEKLTVATPDGTYDYTRNNAYITTTATGEEWLIEVPVNVEGENVCTVTADYGEAGVTPATAFTVTGIGYCDYDALEAAVAKTPKKSEEYYDAEAYKAWADAKAAGQALLDAEKLYDKDGNQDKIDAAAQLIETTFAALEAKEVDLTKLNNAVDAYDELAYGKDYYDADLYAAWEAALADATAAQKTYDGAPATKQAEADKFADDLQAAFTALNPSILDLTALNNAIEASDETEYAAEYYDAAEYAAWEQALADAQAGVTTYTGAADTAANREAVAALAQAIRNTFAKLVPAFVSYEKLEKAVADYAQPEHPEFYYTPDSWAAYQDALAAANDANNNRPQPLPAANDNNQAAVDAYADALEKAYNELTAAVCHIISVTPLQEIYDLNDVINLSVLVEGKATKVQLIRGTNATSTYTRTHTSVKSITDNGDGTETWVIARRVYEKDYTEYAKAKFGKVWDTGVYAYDLVCKGDDISVKSIEVTLDGEVVDTVTRADLPTLTIVTGPAVKKLRLVDPVTGGAISFSAPVSVNEDGTKVWVIVKQYNQVKMYDLDVSVKGSAGWVDSGVDFELNVVKKVESQLPSTDNVEDAILSASVAKTRILRGVTQTFTITTDKAAKSVRILKADGSVFTTISAPVSVEGDVATWTYECSYSSIGERSYTAEALYGNTWIADADSAVNFTVIY